MTHPLLADLFRALDEESLAWLLVRVPADLAAPSGDVDLLVAADAAPGVRRTAERLGFVAMPGWSGPPNLILVRYDRPSDRWLVLDVATTLAFDDGRAAPRVAVEEILGRRRRDGELWRPHRHDAFWLLALHCALDKGAIAEHYRGPLRAGAAGAGGPLAAALPTEVRERLRAAAAAGDRDLLVACAEPLRAALRVPWVPATRLVRWARKPLLLPRRRGVTVALLGSNGAGKSTLAGGLRAQLPLPSDLVYMGMWKADSDKPGLGAALGRPVLLWRRYARALGRQLRGHVVLFDRYAYDARLPPTPPLVPLKRIYLQVLAHALPAPDLAIVLDLPPEVAYARKQENTPEELASEREVYRRLSTQLRNAAVVDASRPSDEVRSEVTDLLWQRLSDRWRGR